MRKITGWVLLLLGLVAAVTFVPQVRAYFQGSVGVGPGSTASYAITQTPGAAPNNNQLIYCSVPSTIVLRNNSARAGNYFSCRNKFNSAVTLRWTVVDDGDGNASQTFLAVGTPGNSTTINANTDGCVNLRLAPGTFNATHTVTFMGESANASDLFYARIYFTATVTVQAGNGGIGGGCP